MSKDPRYVKMINSARWRNLRHKKLNNNPLCEVCYNKGIYVSATEVHHVVPVESSRTYKGMAELMFSFKNLQSLCHDCHVQVHLDMSSHSKVAQKTKASKDTEKFKNKFF